MAFPRPKPCKPCNYEGPTGPRGPRGPRGHDGDTVIKIGNPVIDGIPGDILVVGSDGNLSQIPNETDFGKDSIIDAGRRTGEDGQINAGRRVL